MQTAVLYPVKRPLPMLVLQGRDAVVLVFAGESGHYYGILCRRENPVKYTDPDGKNTDVATMQQVAVAVGSFLALAPEAVTTVIGLLILAYIGTDIINDTNQANEANTKKGDDAGKKIQENAQAAAPVPPPPDPNDKEKKSSRNQPQTEGEPNSTQVERNPDGSVKRVTQYDDKGNIIKEVRPKSSHGSEGPTTKYPETNTNPETGESFRRFRVRPATPDEILLLQ